MDQEIQGVELPNAAVKRGPGRPKRVEPVIGVAEEPNVAQTENENDPYLIKIGQRADGAKQKELNVKRRYVQEHPAICTICRPARDFMREHLSKFKRHQIEGYSDPNREGWVEPKWEALTEELRGRLMKALEHHKRTHDAGDYGRIKKSQLPGSFLGSKRGI